MKNASEMEPKSKDWDFVVGLAGVEANEEELQALRVARDAWLNDHKLAGLMPRFAELGMSYQQYLAFAVMTATAEDRSPVIVETGVHTGVSTRLLAEVARSLEGTLISIDPAFTSEKFARDKMIQAAGELPDMGDWRFIGKRSIDALLPLAMELGGWDVFVHDSDHGLECQTFEIEFGWSMLRPGGLLVVNGWKYPKPNGNPHRAFELFCHRRGLEFSTIGSAAVIVKPAREDVVAIQPNPRQMFHAAVVVATTDKSHREPGAPPAYTTYLNH